METVMLKNNMYKDPLTGMYNFFSFIEADFCKIFDEDGTVLIIEIDKLEKFNELYGRGKGDLCLISLAAAIKNVHEKNKKVSMFRTNGDEFTVVFSKTLWSEAEKSMAQLKSEFERLTDYYGLHTPKLKTLVLSYTGGINSIERFYELLLDNSYGNTESHEDKFKANKFLKHTVKVFVNMVKDSLYSCNNAYNLAVTDDVSGLSNHRAGKAYLSNLMEEYESKRSEFSVLFIDGDSLKRYNGISYEAGNKMIRKLSEIITASKRKSDRVYRWLSGDEFLVVLKDTSPDDAVKLADRIRLAVEDDTRDFIYPLTISVGVASWPMDGSSLEDIINKAEQANSLAKRQGKNQVVRWN
mgnify:CR=1 FL=1